MDPAAFVTFVRHQRLVVDYVYISQIAILLYDYLLTLHLEVEFIWFSQWSYTKVLFLVIRYTTFVCISVMNYRQVIPNVAVETCRVLHLTDGWLTFVVIVFAECVLCIRTWAVWSMNKFVGAMLVALTLLNVIGIAILVNPFLMSLKSAPSPYPGYRGCFVSSIDQILWRPYVVVTVVESSVFLLMVISALKSYKSGYTSRLLYVIHRDGILFYIYLLIIAIANLVTSIVLPLDLFTVLTPIQVCMYSVLTTRIVLNIQETARRRGHCCPELHTTQLSEPEPEMISLHPFKTPEYSAPVIVERSSCPINEPGRVHRTKRNVWR